MASTPSFKRFRVVRKSDGTISQEGWNEFLRELDKLQVGGGDLAKNPLQLPGGRSTSSGGNGEEEEGSTSGSQEGSRTDPGILVPNTIGADVGNLVFYADEALRFADARYRPATGVVIKINESGRCRIKAIAETRILLASGDGQSNDTALYLYQEGKATDDPGKLLKQEGRGGFQDGIRWFQPVGRRIGAKSTSFVDALVHIDTARGI